MIIDHPDTRNKDHVSVVCVWSKDEETRKKEIEAKVKLFHSGNGAKTDASNSKFMSSYVWKINNEEALKKHINQSPMVIVYNKETKEFFFGYG